MACPTCGSESPFVCERLRGKKVKELAWAHPWRWNDEECCEDPFHQRHAADFQLSRGNGWQYEPVRGRV